MNRIPAMLVVCSALALLTGCAGEDGATSGSSSRVSSAAVPPAASQVADDLRGEVPTVSRVVVIDETNDPNDLIGRPNGYRSAAVLYDSGTSCEELGADCGATVEVFADEEAARTRGEYIQGVLAEAPVLGAEWSYIDGPTLLRVSGDLKPSDARRYRAAFGGQEVSAPKR